jgi:exopolyphosphatase / guanosine-5'-triphosphate,3'-diphosphate pyrophosphatase
VEGPSDDHRGAAPVVGSQPESDVMPAAAPGGTAAAADDRGRKRSSRFAGDGRAAVASRLAGSDSSRLPVYAALDLGTNSCRLLVARPAARGFRVLDAFSRIIRLGEGVMTSGRLSEAAMARTCDALTICAAKMRRHGVSRSRLVATEACRVAENGAEFVAHIGQALGLQIEILPREAEAMLAVSGCDSLLDLDAELALVFDIGGGSSELIWLDVAQSMSAWRRSPAERVEAASCITAWTSLPVGVVTLAERFGGRHVTEHEFEEMVGAVTQLIAPFEAEHRFRDRLALRKVHLLGTSGTVTTLAAMQLRLPRYDRRRVDGRWLGVAEARGITYDLLGRSYEERVAEPCIGKERADFVLAGCAILEALLRIWPADRLRVADRGLREGILTTLMAGDGHLRTPGRRRRPGRDN